MNIVLAALAIEWVVTFVQKVYSDCPKWLVMIIALALSGLAVWTYPQIAVFGDTLFSKVLTTFAVAGGSRALREFLKLIGK